MVPRTPVNCRAAPSCWYGASAKVGAARGRAGATGDKVSEQTSTEDRIRIGVSSCLLGWEVRYDGGHKYDAYINGTLARYFELVPVCPEVGIGLGVPREPIRLVRRDDGIRVLGVHDPSKDVTEALENYGRRMGAELDDLSGYIFKRASPSCGMDGVKVHSPTGLPAGRSSGVYAREFMRARPLLPCEEEGRLGDPALRESFITRVLVYRRWQQLLRRGLTPGRLVEFHADHKYLVMAHDQAAYRRMGRLVAEAGRRPLEALAEDYVAELMEALSRKASRGAHVNVLQHLLGYVSDKLDAGDRREMLEAIEQFRRGLVPLRVPLTLLRDHFRRHPHPYIQRQHYLNPHPGELMLDDPR